MKYLKMLGLAAVAAAALMALVGAGTASADELCTEPAVSNMCPAGKQITTIHASLVGSAVLEDTEGNSIVTCTAGTLHADVTTQGTGVSGVSGPITALTWGATGTNCNLPTTTITNGTLDGSAAAGGGTTVKATGTRVTVNTILFGSCVYGPGAAGLDVGAIANGSEHLAISTVVNKQSGSGVCPETTFWTATFTVTNHNAVYYISN